MAFSCCTGRAACGPQRRGVASPAPRRRPAPAAAQAPDGVDVPPVAWPRTGLRPPLTAAAPAPGKPRRLQLQSPLPQVEAVFAFAVGQLMDAQAMPWYRREALVAQLPALAPRFAACRAEIALPAYLAKPFHVWLGNESWPSAANGEAVMSFFANVMLDAEGQAEVDRRRADHPNMAATQGCRWNDCRALMVERACEQALVALDCGADQVRRVTDLGCGTGRPTRLLASHFPAATVLGIDASAYAIAWAEHRAEAPDLRGRELHPREVVDSGRVRFAHALAERSGQPDGACDLQLLAFVGHELPRQGRRRILEEARRTTRPGGIVAVVDHQQQGTLNDRYFRQPFRADEIDEAAATLAHRLGDGLGPLWSKLYEGPLKGGAARLVDSADGHYLGDRGRAAYRQLGRAVHAFNNVGAPEPYLKAWHRELMGDSFAAAGLQDLGCVPISSGQAVYLGRRPAH